MKRHPLAIAVGLGTLLMLAGCGDDSSDNVTVDPPQPNPQPQTTMSVTAIDGYLNGALVWLDLNKNFVLDGDEKGQVTGAGGKAELDVTGIESPEAFPVVVKAIPGETIDEDSPDKPITTGFVMSAPAGETEVTPLSTLVHIKMVSDNTMTQDEARQSVAEELGISEDDVLGDFIESDKAEVAKKASLIVKAEVLPKTPEVFDTEDLQQAYDATKELIKEVQDGETVIVTENGVVKATDDDDDDDDGHPDTDDAFPNNDQEWRDLDGDGIGDNADTDDDNDTYLDENDAFPHDAEEWLDFDEDDIGDNADPDDDNDTYLDSEDDFPKNAEEWVDADEDGYGDNLADKFPADKTEWADTDGDDVGDNSDKFPTDANEWADADEDGYGDNLADQFPDNAEKAVADVTSSSQTTGPVMVHLLSDVRELISNTNVLIETLNNGDIRTTKSISYSIAATGRYFGEEQETDLLHQSGDFSRISNWEYDFNQDGQVTFEGKALDLGTRTLQGETYWRYVDEDEAEPEGGDNGPAPREYDDLDLVAQIDARDLTGVDIIQYVNVTRELVDTTETITTNVKQYPLNGFDFDAEEYFPEYQYQSAATYNNDTLAYFEEERDWNVDGLANVSFQLTINNEPGYTFAYQRPIWANPHSADFEEYSHYTYVQGKAGELGPQWYEVNRQVNWQDGLKTTLQSGKRYLLDETDGRHLKLVNETNPDGVLFSQYQTLDREVSEFEVVETSNWTMFAIDDSYFGQDRENFTVLADDMGQDYKIFQRLDNGMWLGHRFSEWGSQNVVDLAGQVEALRAQNYELAQITAAELPGLSDYDGKILTSSFRIDENGQPVTWHFITNHPVITGSEDGSYQLLDITLTNNGIKEGWLVNDNGVGTIVISVPFTDDPWDWYNAYWRMMVEADSLNVNQEMKTYSWTSWLGEFYLDQAQANARAEELGVGVKEYTVCSEGDTGWDEENDIPLDSPSYQDFLASANSCQYEPATLADVGGSEIYRLNGRNELRHWVFNEDGTGQYFRNGYPDGEFSWVINADGVVVVDYGNGDLDYFAYVSSDDERISFKLYSEWTEDEQPLTDIWSSGFTFARPEDYTVRSCKVDIPNATEEDFTNAIQSCGGHYVVTEEDAAEIAKTMFVRIRGAGDTRAYQFNADNSVTYYRAGEKLESATRTWARTDEGYLKLIWDSGNQDEYMLLANLLYSDDQSSFVTYDVYQEDNELIREVWSFVFREYDDEAIMGCKEGDSSWSEENDQPSSFNRISDYYDAVEQCLVKTDDRVLKFTEDMLVGKNDKTSLWSITVFNGYDNDGNPIYEEDEQIRFSPDRTGAFVDAEDGDFGFNWEITDGQLVLSLTHNEYLGSSEVVSLVETDGEYFAAKSFWIDTSGEWSNPAPAEGEGEIFGYILKQISKE
ncbi:hypothetical protein MD588_13855 [Photobacterium sp. SDRW27]|uniref:hypothetical protein n=1 Tax=Photobacterium obscurum TaxID=2829490 RepID=UPI0022430752|nr:hypothetical protein [Photobacterium obscurum]MCW8329891.1 hypothetical protein [Photobacterium obscurum]